MKFSNQPPSIQQQARQFTEVLKTIFKATTVTNKDIRKFLDGNCVSEKGTVRTVTFPHIYLLEVANEHISINLCI